MTDPPPAHIQFWGKTPAEGQPGAPFKPATHHLIDVAAVALTFLQAQQARLRREAALLGMEAKDYAPLVAFLAGLHDLGKFSAGFQFQRADLWPACLGRLPLTPPDRIPHWRMTAVMLREAPLRAKLAEILPELSHGRDAHLIAAVAGHHGRPPKNELDEHKPAFPGYDAMQQQAAAEAFDVLRRLTGVERAPAIDEDNSALFSWRLSGLITLADWVGSDQAFFGFQPCDTPLDEYWIWAQERARAALAHKGLCPVAPRKTPSLAALAPQAALAPRPMQLSVETLALGAGPSLFLIEDATGSGKTEAALLLAARLIAAGLGEGVYIALPTMATANAMHGRALQFRDGLFETTPDERAPVLILAHGKAALARALEESRAPRREEEGEDDATAAAAGDDWIADDRRRAFFADVGVGTVDQAFLAVLPKKHLTLRQYALAGRILIIDEAHSFDAYMRQELATLLRLHAANGGSAIVLSATLSLSARRDIAAAFYEGRGDTLKKATKKAESCASTHYPLLTHIGSGVIEKCSSIADELARSVDVVRLDGRDAAMQAAGDAVDKGAAVLFLCNAVDEAIAVHAALRATRGENVHLFHARFAQCDRMAIEAMVLARFGRKPKLPRAGHILVATQVAEQSLDLDFDLVISDLAPIDLLIQRAGRLWRHMQERPRDKRPVTDPTLMVVSPDPDPAAITQADWLGACLGKAAAIYPAAGVMWRSARTIFAKASFAVPDDLRAMIEAVYGDGEPVPEILKKGETKEQGEEGAAKAMGGLNVIEIDDGYGALRSDLRADEEIGTRLQDDATTIVRLARRRGGALVPWCEEARLPPHVAWALSEVRLRRKIWGAANRPAEDAALHAAARKGWSEFDDGIALAEVEEGGRLRVEGENFCYSLFQGLYETAQVV